MPKESETSATVRRPSESHLKALLRQGKFPKQKPLPPQVPDVSEEVAASLWEGGVGPDGMYIKEKFGPESGDKPKAKVK